MPYRAILTTIVTVALALLAVSMWVSAVAPFLAEARASTQPAAGATMPQPIAAAASTAPTADKSVAKVINRTMSLAFTLICTLMAIGFFASMREWLRYWMMLPMARTGKKTKYVDAWKIAGERAKADPPEEVPPENPEE